VRIEPRPDWRAIVSAQGLVYCETLHPDGEIRPYWEDGAYYAFAPEEVRELERVSAELFAMCIEAGDRIVERGLWREMGIAEHAVERIVETWHSEPPSVIGRFDLRYDGRSPPKLLEFNADTPTSLVESAVVQWNWLEDRFPEEDQWNEIHDRLLHAWRRQLPAGSRIHFAHTTAERSGEDMMNTVYLQDTAEQAGARDRCARRRGDRLAPAARLRRRARAPHRADLQALSVGVDGRGGVRPPLPRLDGPRRDFDPVDRADLQDAVVEQGSPGGSVGALPRAPQPPAHLL
jgi:glutathionylspermidine synthase